MRHPDRPPRLWYTEQRAAIRGLKSGRRLGDYPVPDRAFMASLRRYDPDMLATFNRVTERWIIWKFCPSGWQIMMGVQDDLQEYQPLGYQVLLTLAQMNVFARGWQGLEEVASQVRRERELERRHERGEDEYVSRQFAPTYKKEAENLVGSINVPKEDINRPLRDRLLRAEIDVETEEAKELALTV